MYAYATTQLTQSEGVAKICKINCEQQGIPYYRFSPEMGEDVGTAETDNIKLCDMIIRYMYLYCLLGFVFNLNTILSAVEKQC